MRTLLASSRVVVLTTAAALVVASSLLPSAHAFAPQGQRAVFVSSAPPQNLHQKFAAATTTTSLFENDPAMTTVEPKQQAATTTTPITSSDSSTLSSTSSSLPATNGDAQQQQQCRILGSQELLMLPRQYGPGSKDNVVFPSMNHVSVARLSATPSTAVLQQAVDYVMQAHPLLHSFVQGDGEPTKRIDLFQMVRQGEPNPLTFCTAAPNQFSAASDVLKVVHVNNGDDETESAAALDASWKAVFQRDLDDGSWCNTAKGPLWKLELHRISGNNDSAAADTPCALVLSFNHAISDQSSANRLTDQILRRIAEIEAGKATTSNKPPVVKTMPVTLEDSVLGEHQRWNDVQTAGLSLQTIKYVARKAAEGFKSPVILPDQPQDDDAKTSNNNPLGALTIISGKTAGGQDEGSAERQSTLQFRTLSKDTTAALLATCRANGVSISNALTAAMAFTLTDFIGLNKKRHYKILQSLDMRRFGAQLDSGETVACMAGSHDLMHGPLKDGSGAALRRHPTAERQQQFWNLAREGKQQTADFIAQQGPQQAVRVFDFAMSISDLNNLVYLTAQSADTKGRAYSAGVTNVGVYERQTAFSDSGEERDLLQLEHGRYQVQDVFFATPHKQSGCLYPVSCLTVDGRLQFTFTPVAPMVSEETNERFADAMIEMLEIMAGTKEASTLETEDPEDESKGLASFLPENILTLTAAAVGLVAVLSHAGDWATFFESVQQMKENVDDPADFWAALNFWIFFAVGHPILQPILALSDVLHGSPGPMVGGLVPATFLAGNLLVIGAFLKSQDFRNAVNIAAVSAFFAYVGAGLGGTAGLGDFNLGLDDSYKGQIVKGCPAYDQVRQPSMDGFDINKYQGLWYEQKFHDWTQFKEVYDTTLGIKLTEDGKGWVDDFAVKGPAPDAAPLSWDKSPVANGAHYFLFGRIDEKDPPGILREKGFGVEFPNYIVDVQKDPVTGEYTEAIQFQCLERGGVRVFEGINFMSRKDTMTAAEMAAMHARAEKAGMYPYGASPEQMHTVARRPVDAPELDNNWQAMWRAIGLDKLLELLTEAIEDGGR